jgi:fructokinase
VVPCPSTDPRAARLARELGVPVAFDVNLREHLWLGLEEAREAVEPLLNLSIIVKLGDDELEPLLDTANTQEAAERLLGRGISLVLISFGERGAFSARGAPTTPQGGSAGASRPSRSRPWTLRGPETLSSPRHWPTSLMIPAGPYEEERVREATHRGSAAGALACTDYGAMRALPTKDELEHFLDGQK